jgi:hypothetical protein
MSEWPEHDNLESMQPALSGRAVSERKARLFNVACCRRVWHLYGKEAVREAILTGERYADGLADREQLREALRAIHRERARAPISSAWEAALHAAGFTAAEPVIPAPPAFRMHAARAVAQAVVCLGSDAGAEERALCQLARDVFGPPSRVASVAPAWRTPTVVGLAEAIYSGRTFDDLPVLADALEEAGCDDEGLIGHFRGPGLHMRGCWALDEVLGRA